MWLACCGCSAKRRRRLPVRQLLAFIDHVLTALSIPASFLHVTDGYVPFQSQADSFLVPKVCMIPWLLLFVQSDAHLPL